MTIAIPLSKTGKYAGRFFAYVDEADDILALSDWCVYKPQSGNPYALKAARNKEGRKTLVLMHRIVMERKLERPLLSTEFIDHIDGDGFNNSRSNLRIATISQNGANRKVGKNSKSGIRGVYWSKKAGKWTAHIKFQSKQTYLGAFDDIEDARKIRNIKGRELFGEFWREC